MTWPLTAVYVLLPHPYPGLVLTVTEPQNHRAKFIEGAIWFGHRALGKCDRLISRVENLTRTFTRAAAVSQSDTEKLAFAFAKDLETAAIRCRTKVHRMFDEILHDGDVHDDVGQSASDFGTDTLSDET